jgi:hypothetical protein
VKRPINIKRESAFQMEIAIPSGATLSGIFSLGKVAYALSNKSIHAIKMADSIDPDRKNHNIPHVQQLVLNYGADDEFVGRTLLTGIELILKGMVRDDVDKEGALKIIFDITVLIAEARDFHLEYARKLEEIAVKFDRKLKGSSLELPHYERLTERVKTFTSKVADAGQRLFDLYVHFYGRTDEMWSGAKKVIETRYGSDDPFSDYMGRAVPFLRFLRNTRNCIQHEKPTQRIVVTDFELQADGVIHTPMIEVVHPETPEPKVDLGAFLSHLEQSLVVVCEHMIVLLADKHAADFGELDFRVVELPKDRWRNHVRFAFHPFQKDGSHLVLPG